MHAGNSPFEDCQLVWSRQTGKVDNSLHHFGDCKAKPNNLSGCHQNNLICTTHRLTCDTIAYKVDLFLPLLWRSIPSPQAYILKSLGSGLIDTVGGAGRPQDFESITKKPRLCRPRSLHIWTSPFLNVIGLQTQHIYKLLRAWINRPLWRPLVDNLT